MLSSRKGEFGLLEIVSMVVYVTAFIILMVLAGLFHSCSNISTDTRSIEANTNELQKLEANQDLVAILRTPMPPRAQLDGMIDELHNRGDLLKFLGGNVEHVKDDLDEYPEVIHGSFADFIVNLYEIRNVRDMDGNNIGEDKIFQVVSTAMFHREIGTSGEYYMPSLAIHYGTNTDFGLDGRSNDISARSIDEIRFTTQTESAYVHLSTSGGEPLTVLLVRPAYIGNNRDLLPEPAPGPP